MCSKHGKLLFQDHKNNHTHFKDNREYILGIDNIVPIDLYMVRFCSDYYYKSGHHDDFQKTWFSLSISTTERIS